MRGKKSKRKGVKKKGARWNGKGRTKSALEMWQRVFTRTCVVRVGRRRLANLADRLGRQWKGKTSRSCKRVDCSCADVADRIGFGRTSELFFKRQLLPSHSHCVVSRFVFSFVQHRMRCRRIRLLYYPSSGLCVFTHPWAPFLFLPLSLTFCLSLVRACATVSLRWLSLAARLGVKEASNGPFRSFVRRDNVFNQYLGPFCMYSQGLFRRWFERFG